MPLTITGTGVHSYPHLLSSHPGVALLLLRRLAPALTVVDRSEVYRRGHAPPRGVIINAYGGAPNPAPPATCPPKTGARLDGHAVGVTCILYAAWSRMSMAWERGVRPFFARVNVPRVNAAPSGERAKKWCAPGAWGRVREKPAHAPGARALAARPAPMCAGAPRTTSP